MVQYNALTKSFSIKNLIKNNPVKSGAAIGAGTGTAISLIGAKKEALNRGYKKGSKEYNLYIAKRLGKAGILGVGIGAGVGVGADKGLKLYKTRKKILSEIDRRNDKLEGLGNKVGGIRSLVDPYKPPKRSNTNAIKQGLIGAGAGSVIGAGTAYGKSKWDLRDLDGDVDPKEKRKYIRSQVLKGAKLGAGLGSVVGGIKGHLKDRKEYPNIRREYDSAYEDYMSTRLKSQRKAHRDDVNRLKKLRTNRITSMTEFDKNLYHNGLPKDHYDRLKELSMSPEKLVAKYGGFKYDKHNLDLHWK